METLDKKKKKYRGIPRVRSMEMFFGALAIVAGIVLVWAVLSISENIPLMMVAGILFTICVAAIIRLLMDPDSVRARQTDNMLQLSSQMIDVTQRGLSMETAREVCELLLPSTAAIAVAITDRETILGYVGYMETDSPSGAPIRTQATHDAIADGAARVIYTAQEIGFPKGGNVIKAAIIIPLKVGREIRGTLKFYYGNPRRITETQKSIAQGFGKLLSTQIAAAEMEEQRELATSMELKMLQSQINPHFLFNTINTIASLIRTDPAKARVLLRDFATFYRSTLENSQDRIELAREIEQTKRYFSFEVARFGEDRLEMVVKTDSSVEELMVPPFLLQPLVENAVKHAMRADGKLTVVLDAHVEGADVLLVVADDGVGMTEDECNNIMNANSETGLGIAVKNVRDRLRGFFGSDAAMIVESELGRGTKVTLVLPGCANRSTELDDLE